MKPILGFLLVAGRRSLVAFVAFLRGATGLAFPVARCTKHDARSFAARLEHKYSQPTRCC